MKRIMIRAGSVEMLAELNESSTAGRVYGAIPIRSTARTWGEEVYFDAGVSIDEESPAAHVPPGTVAYWPPGKAICVFFGQTPASPVNVIGELKGNPRDFAKVAPADAVQVSAAPE
jgi:hypothetical protein